MRRRQTSRVSSAVEESRASCPEAPSVDIELSTSSMWMVEDCLEGRISLGKSRQGNIPNKVTLQLPGKLVYQLQKYFEEEAAKGGQYFRVRWQVSVAEHLRLAVARAPKPESEG
jgi:hypothetical protein